MTQYSGLCIGGPLDGQCAVSKTQRLQADELPALPPISASPVKEIPADMGITRHTYLWLHTGGLGLWLVEGTTLQDAIQAMALAYMEAHKK